MKKTLIASVLMVLLCGLSAVPARAQDAQSSAVPPQPAAPAMCDKPDLTPEERTEKSDLVVKGTIMDVKCKCQMGTSGPSYDSAMIPCKLNVMLGDVLKGTPPTSMITLPGNAGDPSLDWGMDKKLCNGFISKYTNEMMEKTQTYYLMYDKGTFKETPTSGCAP